MTLWPGIGVLRATKSYVDTSMGQVHVYRRGTDQGTPLLLIHQTPWFSVQYAKVLPLLAAAGFDVIAIDTPGYGLSDVPDDPPTIEAYADNLTFVLDALGLEKTAIAGHHTGASIAAAFAHRHPNRTLCAILHGVPLYTDEQRADRLRSQVHNDLSLHADGSHLSARFRRVREKFAPKATLESIQWSVLGFFWASATEWYGHQAAFTFDMASAIKNITRPTLIISNTSDSVHEASKRVIEIRPDFAYAELEGGSPHIFYDDPQPWAEIVTDFVKKMAAKL